MEERVLNPTTTLADRTAWSSETGTARRLVALFLVVLSFAVYWWVGGTFDRLDVYAQYNVLYDADPNARLPCYANGWGDGRSLVHPNLCNLINPWVRMIAMPAAILGLADAEQVRYGLSLMVAPLFAGLSVALVFSSLLLLGCRGAAALALTLLYAFSFSQLLFGSIPDHFALGGFSLTLSLWLMLLSLCQRRIRVLPWALAGALTLSVTLTNALLFILFFALAAVPSLGRKQALRTGVRIGALAVALVLLVKVPMDIAYGGGRNELGAARDFTGAYLHEQPLAALAEFPGTVVAAFVAPESTTLPQRENLQEGRYPFQLTLKGKAYAYPSPLARAAAMVMATLLIVALGAGITLARAGDALDRALLGAATGSLLFNALLHAGWGSEYFLYSQHWFAASTLLLAFIARSVLGRSRALPVAFTTAAVLVAAANFEGLLRIFAMLEQASGA